MIRILLCGHNLLIRSGLRKILEDEPDITVIAEVDGAAEAVEVAQRLGPDVVFAELDPPHVDGLQLARLLTRGTAADPVGVVFIAQTFDSSQALRGLLAGARAFLAKSDPPWQLVAAARTVAAGYAVLPPGVVASLEPWALLCTVDAPTRSDRFGDLTAREFEVLRLMAAGLSNGEIARCLSLGEATVKSHVSRLLAKLGLRNRSQAVAKAYGAGLISVPPRAAR
ncbi:response regulator transcription factor [Streptomyces sp. LX-29]|uniref:response regulator transcription factor n=1 Tax=Streptomyces sp. LX-29 TaxID=2900152 RepID=UPI00240E2491|nr:response regulator transcription factor [Streptomyces sp. LX-29]WFB10838.1 response regulator transcription factor [Streptomyces sp. LX-29]